MTDEITIGVQIGRVTFSFLTDDRGSNIRQVMKNIKEIAATHKPLFDNLRVEDQKSADTIRTSARTIKKRTGGAETTIILGKLEESLLPKSYFKDARTTGDVKRELKKQTGLDFTSRKVSQALGLMFNKKILARIGGKGNFHYIQQ